MDKDSKNFPTDIFGISQFGVDKWYETYSSPVTSQEFQGFYDAIYQSFQELADSEEKNDAYWIFICNHKVFLFLAHQCLYQLRFERLLQQGYKYALSNKKEPITDAIESLKDCFFTDSTRFSIDLYRRCQCHWRKIRTNWKNVSLIESLFPAYSGNENFLLGDRNKRELKAFISSLSKNPVVLQDRLFSTPLIGVNPSVIESKMIENYTLKFHQKLTENIPIYSKFAGESFLLKLQDYYFNCLKNFVNCRAALKKWQPVSLMLQAHGNTFHRLMAYAWRKRGGKTITFTHGNNYCTYYKPSIIQSGNHAIFDELIACSNGERSVLNRAKKDFKSGLGTFKSVAVNPVNIYKPVYNKFQNISPPTKIKKLMIVGCPMSFHYHTFHPEHHAFAYLHLELSLIKSLRNKGFDLLYKVHPDTFSVVKNIMEGRVDKIIAGRFEDHICDADCFILGTPATSVFGYAMLTHLPMVVINVKGNYWLPEALELVKKRCVLVNAEADKNGRVNFVPSELHEAIKKSKELLDHSIVKEYAL